MRSDTLCVVTNFSLHGVTVKRSDVALRMSVNPLRIREKTSAPGSDSGVRTPQSQSSLLCTTFRFAPGDGLLPSSTVIVELIGSFICLHFFLTVDVIYGQ